MNLGNNLFEGKTNMLSVLPVSSTRTQQKKIFINDKQWAAPANETNALLVGGFNSKVCHNTVNICGSSLGCL